MDYTNIIFLFLEKGYLILNLKAEFTRKIAYGSYLCCGLKTLSDKCQYEDPATEKKCKL